MEFYAGRSSFVVQYVSWHLTQVFPTVKALWVRTSCHTPPRAALTLRVRQGFEVSDRASTSQKPLPLVRA
eukprot:2784189-Amphidinium_carterae.2